MRFKKRAEIVALLSFDVSLPTLRRTTDKAGR